MKRTHAVTLALAAVLALASGCNDNNKDHSARLNAQTQSPGASATAPATSSTAMSSPAAATTPSPSPSSGVGSRYWYEGDTFGNPLKRHTPQEAGIMQSLLAEINGERVGAGLAPFQSDDVAGVAAKAHSEDMRGRNYFDHLTPEGWTPVDRYSMLGGSPLDVRSENVYQGGLLARQILDTWLSSAGHRANLLAPGHTHAGLGVCEAGGQVTAVFTQK